MRLFLILGNGKHTVNDINVHMCTHVIYSFATLDANKYEMKVFDTYLDINLKNYAKFVRLKKRNPEVKLIVALGGWTDSQNNKQAYKTMFSSANKRKNFAK